jgi:tRNA-splicing ligase RtcB
MQVVYDETGRIWIMLHSGSRNIGNTTAAHYDKLAAGELEKQGLKLRGGLNYFEVDSEEGQEYLQVGGLWVRI